MKLIEESLSTGYVPVKPVIFEKKTGIILLNDTNKQHVVGLILFGGEKGKYCLYPRFSGITLENMDTPTTLVPSRDIIAFVEPSEDERVVDWYEKKEFCSADGEWVNAAQAGNGVGRIL